MLDNFISIFILILSIWLFRRIARLIQEEATTDEVLTNKQAWLEHGLRKDWMRGYCATHDAWTTRDEELLYEEYDDPCIAIFRLID